MDRQTILQTLQTLRPELEAEGVRVIGLFGSYARGDTTRESDIDILIETTDRFIETHGGFGSVIRLDEIKQQLQTLLGRKVDLADKKGLSPIGEKYILPEVIHA